MVFFFFFFFFFMLPLGGPLNVRPRGVGRCGSLSGFVRVLTLRLEQGNIYSSL